MGQDYRGLLKETLTTSLELRQDNCQAFPPNTRAECRDIEENLLEKVLSGGKYRIVLKFTQKAGRN